MRIQRVRALLVAICGVSLLSVGAFGKATVPSDEVPEGLSAGDWSSIRAAYESNRHAAFPVENGYQVRNPGQQWVTHFDGRGFTTVPDAGGWTWGLELMSYGFAGEERDVQNPTAVRTDGQRVAYEWDAALEEWYVNDQRGLEHGYTVHKRPSPDAKGPLTFTLAVRGGLRPAVQENGHGVRFVSGDGVAMLTYTGLSVLDADGLAVSARLQKTGDGLLLIVDELEARYPLTIDPIAQQAYLKASNTEVGDSFGESISVSGDTVVVGAPREKSSATGVDGDQSDNSAYASGAAYVFVRSGTTWSQQAYLKASNTEVWDLFGQQVSVSGDTVVVGAMFESSSATGVDGNQSDNSARWSGAAYVFVRSGAMWSQQAYLKASNTDAQDRFGESVSVSGDTIVVGASLEDSSATGVNGNQSDNSLSWSGAVYVFVRSGVIWSQQAYLKASNPENVDAFGSTVSVSDDTVVVGATHEDSSATGVNGNQSDNSANTSGAAYVFVRSGTTWNQQAYLKASNAGSFDFFGNSVSVSGDTVVVGAFGERSDATGVNGDQADNSLTTAGAAYVFVRSGAMWNQQAYLKASNTDRNDRFGDSVSVSGDKVVVGAYGEDSGATGVNGNQTDNSAAVSGAVYVFVRRGAMWNQQAYLKASNTDAEDRFGESVSVSGDTVVVGANRERSSATGVNGNQGDNSALASGAAYVFDVSPWTDLGNGLAGSGGVTPLLVGDGILRPGTPATLTLSNALPGSNAWLFVGLSQVDVPFKGGILVPSNDFPLVELPADGSGGIAIAANWPALPLGTSVYFQYWVLDPGGPFGASASNGLVGTTQ